MKIFTFFFILILFISINSLLQTFDINLFLKSISLIRFPLFILFPLIVEIKLDNLKKKINYLFILPIIIFLFNLYTQAFYSFDIFGRSLDNDYQRVTSFFRGEFIAGTYLLFIFSIVFFYFEEFDLKKFILLSIIYFGVLLSGDRTPFITLNLLIFLIIFFNLKLILSYKKTKIYLTIIILIFSSFYILNEIKVFNLTAYEKYRNTFKDIRNDLTKKSQDDNNLGLKRWAYYGLYMKSYVIFKHNYIFGVSYKKFRSECDNKIYEEDYKKLTKNIEFNGCSTHPHNIFLEILAEQGLIGFILLLFFIKDLYKKIKFKSKKQEIFYKIFIFTILFPLKPFGSFYTNFGLIMLSSAISYFLLLNKIQYTRAKNYNNLSK